MTPGISGQAREEADADLDQLERLHAATSEGEWTVLTDPGDRTTAPHHMIDVNEEHRWIRAEGEQDLQAWNNLQFAAHLHDVLPSLIAEIRAYRAASLNPGPSAARDYLDEMNQDGRIEYSDYSNLWDLIPDDVEPNEATLDAIAREVYRVLYPGAIRTHDTHRTPERDAAEHDRAYVTWDEGRAGTSAKQVSYGVARRLSARFALTAARTARDATDRPVGVRIYQHGPASLYCMDCDHYHGPEVDCTADGVTIDLGTATDRPVGGAR